MKKSFRPISVILALLFVFSSVFSLPIIAAQQFNTNLQGCTAVSGTWTASDGLTAQGTGDNFYMSSNNMSDMLYSADVNIVSGTAAALVFRSDANATHCYVVNFDISQKNVRLFKFPYTGSSCDLGTYPTTLSNNTTYNLAVRAIGSQITVYFNHQKVIDATDSTYASGVAGLDIYSSTTNFQNVYINDGTMRSVEPVSADTYIGAQPLLPSTVMVDFDNDIHEPFGVTWDAVTAAELAQNGSFQVSGAVEGSTLKAAATVNVKPFSTNLQGGSAVSGNWTVGGTLQGTGTGDNFYMFSNSQSDLTYSADINMSTGGAASLMFRSNANGTQCYVANYDVGQQKVRLFKFPYTGSSCDLGAYPTTLSLNTTYNLAVRAIGTHICVYWNHAKVIDATDSSYASGLAGVGIWSSTANFQNLYISDGTVTSVDPVSLTTFAGVAPQLPQTVNVNFGNGVAEQFAVDWDNIDSSKLAAAGTFTVNGTLEDTDVKAVATITVKGYTSNLQNTRVVSGSWNAGDVLQATGTNDNFLMSSNNMSDLLYSADVNIVSGTAAALIFRSDADASHSYVANYDISQQNVRLFKFPYTDSSCTLGSYNTSVSNNKTYNLAVRAVGSHIMVYFNHQKVIDVTDTTYTSGFAGLNVCSSTTDFQNVLINDGSVQSIDPVNISTYVGISQTLPDTVRVNFQNGLYELYPVQWASVDSSKWTQAGTFTVSGTVPDAGKTVTANVQVTALSGRTVTSIAAVPDMSVKYPTVTEALGLPSSLNVTLDDGTVLPMNITWDTSAYQDKDGTYKLSGAIGVLPGVTNPNSVKAAVNVTVSGQSTYYMEPYRPQFHFTPASMWMNDPNGLIYYNGEYHLFYQYNPDATVWGPMNWGHAESTDLMHWTHLPIALKPDPIGTMFSGSAVADTKDMSGFFNGGSGLVAIFSYSTQQVGIAYSSDNGLTWTKYSGNPVIPNPGVSDFRDPKVFWYAPGNEWIMVVAGGTLHIYSSPDLKNWKLESNNTNITTECPDLYELPVDGDAANSKWVLSLAGSAYYIGSFDGHSFTPESPRYTMNYGSDSYASQTYNDTEGRRIMLSWMNNGSYSSQLSTNAWNGTMTVPYQMTLKTAPDGTVRLYQTPVDEVSTVRHDDTSFKNVTVTPDTNILKNLRGRALDITAEFQVNGTSKFGFKVLGTSTSAAVISYDAASKTLTLDRSLLPDLNISAMKNSSSCTLAPINNVIKLRILVDNSTIEVFGNDGQTVTTDLAFPDPAGDALTLYTQGENLTVNSLDVYQMSSTWRDDASQAKISLDHNSLTLNAGDTQTLTSTVTPSVVSDSTVTWKVQDDNVASITVSDSNKVVVEGKNAGTTTVTASTYGGTVLAQCAVTVNGSGSSSQNSSSTNSGGDSSSVASSGGSSSEGASSTPQSITTSDTGTSSVAESSTPETSQSSSSSSAQGSSSSQSSNSSTDNVNTGSDANGRIPLLMFIGLGILLPVLALTRQKLLRHRG